MNELGFQHPEQAQGSDDLVWAWQAPHAHASSGTHINNFCFVLWNEVAAELGHRAKVLLPKTTGSYCSVYHYCLVTMAFVQHQTFLRRLCHLLTYNRGLVKKRKEEERALID